jgi:hypothetical protein
LQLLLETDTETVRPSATSATTWATIPLATSGRAFLHFTHQGGGDGCDYDFKAVADVVMSAVTATTTLHSRDRAGYQSSSTPSMLAKTHRINFPVHCSFCAFNDTPCAVIGAVCSEASGRYIHSLVSHIEMPLF